MNHSGPRTFPTVPCKKYSKLSSHVTYARLPTAHGFAADGMGSERLNLYFTHKLIKFLQTNSQINLHFLRRRKRSVVTYTNLYKLTLNCTNLHKFIQTYTNLHKLTYNTCLTCISYIAGNVRRLLTQTYTNLH